MANELVDVFKVEFATISAAIKADLDDGSLSLGEKVSIGLKLKSSIDKVLGVATPEQKEKFTAALDAVSVFVSTL